jgi:hypothetical protein
MGNHMLKNAQWRPPLGDDVTKIFPFFDGSADMLYVKKTQKVLQKKQILWVMP